MANVSPIFKKGRRKVATNYRPFSLTSISCKIMQIMQIKALSIYIYIFLPQMVFLITTNWCILVLLL